MFIDIPFRELVLPVATFIIGAVIPYLYRKLTYEGLSIKQLEIIRVASQEEFQRKENIVVFSFVVKVANSSKNTMLLDDVCTSELKVEGVHFRPIDYEMKVIKANMQFHFPPSAHPDQTLDYLPMLVKPDEETIMILGFRFRYSGNGETGIVEKLENYIERKGLKVSFRVNGKTRSLSIRVIGLKD